jgi:hypothetical protein
VPRQLEEYEAIILGDVRNMDDSLIAHIDTYVQNGGKLLTTGYTSTQDGLGKPMHTIRLQSLGVLPAYEVFPPSRSTYLRVTDHDKTALGREAFKDFTLMMMYSDFLQCKTKDTAEKYLKLIPNTRFGPPEKAYFTEDEVTDVPGLISNVYGKGKTAFIPWQIGVQYHFKGNYAHKTLFIAALQNLLEVENSIHTDASPLIEMTHLANHNGAFEWIGMINHSGQVGATLGAPIPIYNTTLRFKPVKPIKAIQLIRSGEDIKFEQSEGWVECTVPQLDDFEMILCLY